MKFKTNIKCDGCIAAVTPVLDQAVGKGKWQVDLINPERVLTVEQGAVSAHAIKTSLATVGFQAEEI
jgi:copper chaperone